MPLDGDAMPRPKSAQLARGQRRYRRHVASPKQWQVLHATKTGPCRICLDPASNGRVHSWIQLHHVVSREDHGDDYADNLVPLCPSCHDRVTRRATILRDRAGRVPAAQLLLESLTDTEYAYMIERGGENYAERAYGLRYTR